MKKRTALIAATLSTAMVFGVMPANAETATGTAPTSTPTSTPSAPANTADADQKNDSGKSTESTTTTPPQNALDPDKGLWDTNGASSDSGKQGSFGGSSGLNRLENYVNSNQFKTISIIVSAISAVITVGTQLAAIAVTVSPNAKAQFEAFLKRFG